MIKAPRFNVQNRSIKSSINIKKYTKPNITRTKLNIRTKPSGVSRTYRRIVIDKKTGKPIQPKHIFIPAKDLIIPRTKKFRISKLDNRIRGYRPGIEAPKIRRSSNQIVTVPIDSKYHVKVGGRIIGGQRVGGRIMTIKEYSEWMKLRT